MPLYEIHFKWSMLGHDSVIVRVEEGGKKAALDKFFSSRTRINPNYLIPDALFIEDDPAAIATGDHLIQDLDLEEIIE